MEYFLEKSLSLDGSTSLILVNSNMEIVEEVLLYLNYLEKKGMSENTLDGYCRSLKVYYEWLDSLGIHFHEVKKRNIIDFIDFLNNSNGTKKSANTINKYLAAVSSFYSYYEKIGGYITSNFLVDTNKTSTLEQLIVGEKSVFRNINKNIFRQRVKSKKNTKRLFPEQIEILYDNIPNLYKDKSIIFRNQLIFKLLYETGMRISECLGLRFLDYGEPDPNSDIGFIYLRNHKEIYHMDHSFKTNERDVPVSMDLIFDLEDYILNYRPMNKSYETIFVNHQGPYKGNYMKRSTVTKFFSKLSEFTNIKCSAHMLRHTHGTELAENGYDQLFIRDRLGHSSISSTNTYMHISLDSQVKAYSKFNKMRGALI